MQLNVALQTEIVRFTVLGIQRAIRDVEESINEPERLSGGGGASSFFVSTRTLLRPFVTCQFAQPLSHFQIL